jgi:hypothetical protein
VLYLKRLCVTQFEISRPNSIFTSTSDVVDYVHESQYSFSFKYFHRFPLCYEITFVKNATAVQTAKFVSKLSLRIQHHFEPEAKSESMNPNDESPSSLFSIAGYNQNTSLFSIAGYNQNTSLFTQPMYLVSCLPKSVLCDKNNSSRFAIPFPIKDSPLVFVCAFAKCSP